MIRRVPREQAGEAVELSLSASLAPSSDSEAPARVDEGALTASVARALVLLLGEELRLKPEHIREVVRRELLRVRRATQLELRVHPDDAALLGVGGNEGLGLELSARLQLVSDPALERGGCVLISDLGEVDARLETRLSLALSLLASGAFA